MVQKKNLDKLIIVAGATCTGKSSLAIKIAQSANGSIISADSMQIFKGFDIGTAKVTDIANSGIAHYMLDIVEANGNYSVSEYREDANKCIKNIINSGKRVIVAGGTGMYIDSLIYPMSYGMTPKNEKLRQSLEKDLIKYGNQYIYDKLVALDLARAESLHPNNTRRVIRAIEIALDGGENKSNNEDKREPIRKHIMIGLDMPRDILYQQIETRVDTMFEQGLLNEVETLYKMIGMNSQSMQAIGYKEFAWYFNGEISIDKVKSLIKKNTRNYAKRQLTWFRKYPNIKWFNAIDERDKALAYIMENL